ncbi:hypothetical protein BCR32DRAFT_270995 [Anaeromyces robustus]|uniref:Uncharacterized protein n=1 Tax=Anaeromyces robustus TaxID=1754192 RepID=A0A1Y1WTK9_9FUNG|nr:hypothetical protein BCR32DRAFT_270995 [Anaeromyces robustus]|eukprot:ORX76881.1 hypothetical protein BCR32DRAFT_270995 [Anaeromyces robustus]
MTTTIHDNEIDVINKRIKNILSSYIESIIILIIAYVIIVMDILLNFSKKKEVTQELSGKWHYECPLIRINLILSSIEFIFILYLLVLVMKTWNYIYIFKHIKYIGYSLFVWITIGPVINLISYFTYRQMSFSYFIFNYIFDCICYLAILLLFTWDKIYYILINKGDHVEYYFQILKSEICPIHKSCICSCVRNKDDVDLANEYLEMYRFCSKVLVYSGGNFKYIKKNKADLLKFII